MIAQVDRSLVRPELAFQKLFPLQALGLHLVRRFSDFEPWEDITHWPGLFVPQARSEVLRWPKPERQELFPLQAFGRYLVRRFSDFEPCVDMTHWPGLFVPQAHSEVLCSRRL